MGKRELNRLRKIAFALPEVSERISHGSPSFFIREKKVLCSYHDGTHGTDRETIWCPAPPGVQEELVAMEPERFFRPPYVGPSGWLGVYLDGTGKNKVDWDEVAAILEDSYRKVAPKKLIALLPAASPES